MTVFRQVIPSKNITYLCWLSVAGGVRSYAFSHVEDKKNISVENFEIETITDIRSIPTKIKASKMLKSGGLEKEMFDYVKSLAFSNRIWEIDKIGNLIPVAVKGQVIEEPTQTKDFEIVFEIVYKENEKLNV